MANASRPAIPIIGAALLLLAASPSRADETEIQGTFNGCEYDKTYELMDGRTLTCHTYGYHYAFQPKVYVLDSLKVLIDGEEYYASVD